MLTKYNFCYPVLFMQKTWTNGLFIITDQLYFLLVSKILLKRSRMSVWLWIWSLFSPIQKRPHRTHRLSLRAELSSSNPTSQGIKLGSNGGINAACLLLLPSPFPSSPLLSFISHYLSNVDLSRLPMDFILLHLLFRSEQGFLSLSHCNLASLLFSWFFTRIYSVNLCRLHMLF